MARHSHWAQIKLKKGALDKKRGKIFTKHARLIEVACRSAGGDPNTNANLRLAIENARADNMPRENIDRAIKKGTGELKEGQAMEEIVYEGYGPAGVAFMIEALTDNKNRTTQTVRNLLKEYGGALGESGSTSFLFEKKGVLHVKKRAKPRREVGTKQEEDELAIIDCGAEDLNADEEGYIVFCAPSNLAEVKKKLHEAQFEVISAELSEEPKTLVQISNPADSKKILALLEELEGNEDISKVSANFDIRMSS